MQVESWEVRESKIIRYEIDQEEVRDGYEALDSMTTRFSHARAAFTCDEVVVILHIMPNATESDPECDK